MRNETRLQFEKYCATIAQLNGVGDATKKFSVTPSVQQILERKMQESSAFLQRINMVGVRDLKGEVLGLGVTGTVAGRTNVSTNDRAPRDVHGLTKNDYECAFTEFDTAIGYATLDNWSKFPNFQVLLRDAILQRQALDRIMIGLNGISVAAASDRTNNPLLQDVNKGWLQKYRDFNSGSNVLKEGENTGKIVLGVDGDYKNLDAVVYDAVNTLIDPWHQDDTTLVAIMGRGLLSDKYFPLVNDISKPTETIAANMIISQKRVGGLQAVTVPFMPAGKVLVTSLDNLSIYYQESARRRLIMENPKRNRIENYESSNDAYVVEDYGRGCLIENLEWSVADVTPDDDDNT